MHKMMLTKQRLNFITCGNDGKFIKQSLCNLSFQLSFHTHLLQRTAEDFKTVFASAGIIIMTHVCDQQPKQGSVHTLKGKNPSIHSK